MKNNRGIAPIAIILIIIGVLAVGGGSWYYKSQILNVKDKLIKQIKQKQDQVETILINKSGRMYELNLLKNELILHEDIYNDIQKFDGFPLITKNESNGSMFNSVLFSQDRNEVLLYGKTNGEFHCILSLKECFKSSIINDVYKILEENNKNCGALYGWDSKKGFIFAQAVDACQGQFNYPIFIIDVNEKNYKVVKEDILLVDKMFSPLLSNFFTIEENKIKIENTNTINYQFSIFNINNLLEPEKSFEFPVKTVYTYVPSSPGYVTEKYLSGPISFRDAVWSPNKKFIALSSRGQIYLLNIDTGQFDLIYQNESPVYDIGFSSGGGFIVFTDDFKSLKSVDLQKNNFVAEIGEGILIGRNTYPGYYPYVQINQIQNSQTYRNEKYGYEMEYPSNFVYKDLTKSIKEQKTEAHTIIQEDSMIVFGIGNISDRYNYSDLSHRLEISVYSGDFFKASVLTSSEYVTIGGLQWRKEKDKTDPRYKEKVGEIIYAIDKGNYTYIITIPSKIAQNQTEMVVLNQILSTFKFIE